MRFSSFCSWCWSRFKFTSRHVTPGRGDRLKLAAINGYQLTCYQPGSAAKLDESAARRDESGFVVLTEISDGLEIGLESIDRIRSMNPTFKANC